MKPDTLHALLIDRALGELPPDVAQLLDAHLAIDPVARDEARRILATVDLAGQTIRRFPERGHPEAKAAIPRFSQPWLGLAASLLLAALAAAGGYLIGSHQASAPASVARLAPTISPAPVVATAPLPWTRYEVVPGGGEIRVARVLYTPPKQ